MKNPGSILFELLQKKREDRWNRINKAERIFFDNDDLKRTKDRSNQRPVYSYVQRPVLKKPALGKDSCYILLIDLIDLHS